jgi:phage gpG-like protein
MVKITIQADIGQARDVLAKFKQLAANPRPLMEIAGGLLENSIRERFRTSRGPGGVPWQPSKRVLAGGGRTLVDKAGLLNSITHRADERRVEVGIIAKTASAKFGYVHQFGATIRPKRGRYLVFTGADGHKVFATSVTIPPRPFIGIDNDDRADLMAAWSAYLEGLS